MAIRHIKPGDDFQFDHDFGFSESSRRNANGRNHPQDPAGEEAADTYVERARGGHVPGHPMHQQFDLSDRFSEPRAHGGRMHRAEGGGTSQPSTFGHAFAAARLAMLHGGPKTFMWNGKSFTTDLAPESRPSTGAAHLPAPAAESSGRAHMQADANMPATGRAHLAARTEAAGASPSEDESAARFGSIPYKPYVDNQPVGARLGLVSGPQASTGRAHAAAPAEEPALSNQPPNGRTQYQNNYPIGMSAEQNEAEENTSVPRAAHGGRIKRAMGGPMGQTPNGMPGQMAQPVGSAEGPMSHATISMPVADAARAAKGMVNAGKAVGARQAVAGLANAARSRQAAPALPPAAMSSAAAAPRPNTTPGVPELAHGGHMSASQRHALPGSDFALPGERYPINDASHARNALARVAQHGSESERSRVRAAVHHKFPGIGQK